MNILRFLKWTAVSLACVGVLIPRAGMRAADVEQQSAGIVRVADASRHAGQSRLGGDGAAVSQVRYEEPATIRGQAPSSQITDVGLTAGGTLTGLIVDTDGYAVAGIEAVMYQDGQEVVRTVTNESGYFAVTNLTGGVYQLVSGDGQTAARLWAPETAPPGAETEAVVVISAPGQCAEAPVVCEEEGSICNLDLITLALLACCVAGIVIALDDDDDDNPPPRPSSP